MLKLRFVSLVLALAAASTLAVAQESAEAVVDAPAAAEAAAESAEASPAEEQPADDAQEPGLLDSVPQSDSENPGLAALDQAMELKLGASNLKDLNQVIDLLDEAISEGLDASNNDFAEELLVAALSQRANSLSSVILGRPVADPRRDPRWLQIRTFALTDLQRLVSLDDTQLEAWFQIGRLQSLPMGSKSEARRALTRAIRLAEEAAKDPQADVPEPEIVAQAYALRGAAQSAPEKQLADFTAAIELVPDKAEYLLLRAQAKRNGGDAEAMLADIDAAIQLAPDNAKVYELKGLALLMLENQEEAMQSFDKASELAPKMVSPYRYRSALYAQMGELDQGIEQLDKALELSPNNLELLSSRAQLLLVNEDYAAALDDVDDILKQQPASTQAHIMRCKLLNQLDRTDEAVKKLTELINGNPEQAAELKFQLALLYSEKQMATEAIEILSELLEIDPANPVVLRQRADMYLYDGDHAAAIADFERALEVNPQESGVLNNYAWTLATSPYDKVRDGKKAIELATKAAEATEYGAPHIISTLAAAHAEAGDFEEAVRRAEEAVAKAKELGAEEQYDGQLEAELNAYKAEQPWRELQRLEIAGPANETADKLSALNDPAESVKEPEEEPKAEAPAETSPSRSIDF